jgi:hypothetical protein
MDYSIDFTDLIESYSLVFIKDFRNGVVSIDQSDFEDNVALSGVVKIVNAPEVSVTNTRFKK